MIGDFNFGTVAPIIQGLLERKKEEVAPPKILPLLSSAEQPLISEQSPEQISGTEIVNRANGVLNEEAQAYENILINGLGIRPIDNGWEVPKITGEAEKDLETAASILLHGGNAQDVQHWLSEKYKGDDLKQLTEKAQELAKEKNQKR